MKRQTNTSQRGRELLDRLAKIGPFLPASISVTNKRCGRSSCRCNEEGPIHPTAHVTWKEEGTTKTLHVPQEAIGEVVQWVKTWKEVRRIIAEMGKEQRKHLQQIKKQLKD